MSKKKWTAAELDSLIRKRYAKDGWVYASEVCNTTGFDATRRADGIGMGIWPSTGMKIDGFEIKVSRSDWLKELDDIEKADTFIKYCHFWWIVSPDGIIRPSELPMGWGHMIPTSNGSKVRVRVRAAENASAELDYPFLASFLRKALAANAPDQNMVRRIQNDSYDRGYQAARRQYDKKADDIFMRKVGELHQKITDFENFSGISLDTRSQRIRGIGEAFKKFMSLADPLDYIAKMEAVSHRFENMKEMADRDLEILKKLMEDLNDRSEEGIH
jgi:hypothetical protein